MKILFYILLITHLLLSLSSCEIEAKETVVYFVRHAEKDLTDTTENPPLTQIGYDRAQKLVTEFNDVEINAIYSTSFDRNMNTVKPLADQRKISILNYDWYEYHSVLDKIKGEVGNVYLICGHGDNILPMIEYLGGKRPIESLAKHEYDRIFKVVIAGEDVTVEMKQY